MDENIYISVCTNFAQEAQAILELNSIENVKLLSFPAHCGRPPLKSSEIGGANNKGHSTQNCILGSVCLKELKTLNDAENNLSLFHYNTCFEMLLNKELVEHYIQNGSYLVSPGWLNNWEKEIHNSGFDEETAPQFFHEACKSILLLDTGVIAESQNQVKQFASFVGLPYKVLPVGLEHFNLVLSKIISQSVNKRKILAFERNTADYSMMMDLLNNLAESKNESDVTNQIISLFSILFAPAQLFYLSVENEIAIDLISISDVEDEKSIIKDLLNLKDTIVTTSSGFKCKLVHKDELVGAIEICDLAFPQYLEHYQNIATSVIKICALVISNARTYQIIVYQKEELVDALQELKDTQELLVESKKMASLGSLVAGVAHEINTPVGIGVTAASSLIYRTSKLEELFQNNELTQSSFEKSLEGLKLASELILKNMKRTADLVGSFKLISVDETSERLREFNLSSYFNDIFLSINPQLKKKKIKVIIICDDNINVKSYPGALAQIITNLAINSVKHAFGNIKEASIKITAELNEKIIHIKYSHNGAGVPSEILPKIFDPFFTTDKQEGSGLGLHIVYNIVNHKLKGIITCTSEFGNGVVFDIKIPIMVEE